jgi:hypothetical protein
MSTSGKPIETWILDIEANSYIDYYNKYFNLCKLGH